MTRVKRSVSANKKRRKVLAEASGYWGLKSKLYRRAKEQVQRSGNYAYRLKLAGVTADRKILADLAMNEPDAFGSLAERAKSALVA